MYLFFSLSFRYLSLVHWSCDHLVIANIVFIFDIYIYIYLMMLLSHFHLSLQRCFFFLFIHMFLILYAIFYFCFTLRCHNEFYLKCFRNIGFQNLPCHDFSHISFVCCEFVMDYQRRRLLGHIWIML